MSRLSDSDLQRYYDGELSPRQARRVHRLLAESVDDRQRLAALGQLGGLLREHAEDVADEAGFAVDWPRLRGRIASEEQGRAARGWAQALSWRWVGAAVGAAALVLAVVLATLLSKGEATPARNDCVIESLEVGPQAVSTIFTIEGEGDAADRDQTTVIWVSEASEIEDDGESSPEEVR